MGELILIFWRFDMNFFEKRALIKNLTIEEAKKEFENCFDKGKIDINLKLKTLPGTPEVGLINQNNFLQTISWHFLWSFQPLQQTKCFLPMPVFLL